ncbi:MAG: exo-alpha-sialidase [Phycisphaera sp.]|nr:exo-alpha-sialidase [Phycisphaera sp.]
MIGASVIGAACLPSVARAAEPALEQVAVFNAGDDGYAQHRIPGLVVTDKGTLLAYCEARRSMKSDWCAIDVYLRRSTDGGRTWSTAAKIVTPPADVQQNAVALAQHLARPGEVTVNNPVAIVDHDAGVVHFLYCIEYARCYYMRSTDDGVTWSDPVDITDSAFGPFRGDYDWKVIATGPAHGIQLTHGDHKGRLVVPIWMSTGTGGHAHRPSAVSVIYSDDHGGTWRRGDIVVAHPQPINPSETVVVQLADGRVMLNIRHEGSGDTGAKDAPRYRAVSISDDGATNWSAIRYDPALPEPICMGSIARVTRAGVNGADRNAIVFVQPHNPTGRERRNVSVKVSYDEGATWPVMRTLEPGISGYSDVAAAPDGTIYVLYERGAVAGSHYNPATLTLARFNLAWLNEKQ